ncbi:MAG TPA: hypothetical protein VN770_02205 [Gaiellaceae bacterium]|nr:hypothetical protein [Gaiellaceae bacterium]
MRTVLVAVLAALVVAVPGALAGSARTSDNSQTFLDSTGEDPNAPDITSIVVSNDDTGLITFKMNISNRPSLTGDMEIDVFLDTDANPATGDPQSDGAEYAIVLVQGSVALFKWNGSDYVDAPSQSSLVYSYDASGATIKVSASDLGGTKAFNFSTVAGSGITVDANGTPNYSNASADFAPDLGHGTYAYQVKTTLRLSVSTFQTTPAAPKAGATLSASLAATENDTGGPVTGGTVACRATAGGKTVPVTSHAEANGVGTCVWKVPKTAKGKKLTGTVTVTVRGATVSKSFSVRVR